MIIQLRGQSLRLWLEMEFEKFVSPDSVPKTFFRVPIRYIIAWTESEFRACGIHDPISTDGLTLVRTPIEENPVGCDPYQSFINL